MWQYCVGQPKILNPQSSHFTPIKAKNVHVTTANIHVSACKLKTIYFGAHLWLYTVLHQLWITLFIKIWALETFLRSWAWNEQINLWYPQSCFPNLLFLFTGLIYPNGGGSFWYTCTWITDKIIEEGTIHAFINVMHPLYSGYRIRGNFRTGFIFV